MSDKDRESGADQESEVQAHGPGGEHFEAETIQPDEDTNPGILDRHEDEEYPGNFDDQHTRHEGVNFNDILVDKENPGGPGESVFSSDPADKDEVPLNPVGGPGEEHDDLGELSQELERLQGVDSENQRLIEENGQLAERLQESNESVVDLQQQLEEAQRFTPRPQQDERVATLTVILWMAAAIIVAVTLGVVAAVKL